MVVLLLVPPVFRSASRNRGTSAKAAKFAFRPAPGARTSRLEMKPFERKHVRQVDKSSPRLAARDGMEQGPYEFPTHALALASEPKGKATHGEVRNSAFPRFKEFGIRSQGL